MSDPLDIDLFAPEEPAADNTTKEEKENPAMENKQNQNTNVNTEEEAQTIEVAADGSVTVDEPVKFKKSFASRKEANQTLDLLDGLGYEGNYEVTSDGKSIILKGLTERDISVIQRKCNIKLWSDRTQAVANAVTNFATDVADYALNGALAPTAGAVINAGMTTGRVVGTAAVSIGAATLATTIRNGRAAARELKHNRDVQDAWNEVKGLGGDIGSFIFGGEKQNKENSWTAC